MLHTFLDFFFPRHSLTGEEGQWITDAEREQLISHPVIETKEQLRDREIHFLDEIRAGSSYHDCPLLKKAIHTFKYRRVRSLAEDLGTLILIIADWEEGTVLCPVPLHWTRRFARGFNQSDLLAQVVAQKGGFTVAALLKRTRATGHQMRRKRRERLTAVRGAFRCMEPRLPERVILIDDLATTGATLDACAEVLKNAGVKRVEGWVVAHG